MGSIRVSTKGLWCDDCTAALEKATSGIRGVLRTSHQSTEEEAEILYDEASVQRETVLDALRQAGFGSEISE